MYKYSSSKKVAGIVFRINYKLLVTICILDPDFECMQQKCFGVQSTLKDFSSSDSCVLEIMIFGKIYSIDNSTIYVSTSTHLLENNGLCCITLQFS